MVRSRESTGAGDGSANVGVIQGGDATNVITPLVSMRAEARSHDAVFRAKIVDAMRTAFETAASEVKNEAGQSGRVSLNRGLITKPFSCQKTILR